MARSGTNTAARTRGIDLRALRSRRDAVPVSNAYSSEHPDPAVLVEAQAAAAKVAAGDHTHAYTILSTSRASLGQGRPALEIVERAVIAAYTADKQGQQIEGYARRYLTSLKAERRTSPDLARASYEKGAAVHLRKSSDDKGRFQSFCGRTFFPVHVRRGTATSGQLPSDDRPIGMHHEICRRCAPHLDKVDGVFEPILFPVLTETERRQAEIAALNGFCLEPDGFPHWRVTTALAHELQRIAVDRLSRFSARDFDRAWFRDVLGLRNGFFRAYGPEVSSWPVPTREQLEKAVNRLPPALVIKDWDDRLDGTFRTEHDQMVDDMLPVLLASCWQEARDACQVKTEAEIEEDVLGDSARRLREILAASGREL